MRNTTIAISALLCVSASGFSVAATSPTWTDVAKWPDLTGGVWESGGGFGARAAAAAQVASSGAPPPPAPTGDPAASPTARAVQAGRNLAAQLPLTDAARRQYDEHARNFGQPYFGCEPFGFPAAFDGGLEFHYARDVIFVHALKDYITVTRRIYMDGRAHGDPEPTWMGHSVGHWEGRTLVVDTVGLSEDAQIIAGLKGSPASHVVERFTLTPPDTLQWQMSYENPDLLTRPYTASRTLKLKRGKETPEAYCTNNLDVEGLDVKPPQ